MHLIQWLGTAHWTYHTVIQDLQVIYNVCCQCFQTLRPLSLSHRVFIRIEWVQVSTVLRHLGHGEQYVSARCYCFLYRKLNLVFTLHCGLNNCCTIFFLYMKSYIKKPFRNTYRKIFGLVYLPDFSSCHSRDRNGKIKISSKMITVQKFCSFQ